MLKTRMLQYTMLEDLLNEKRQRYLYAEVNDQLSENDVTKIPLIETVGQSVTPRHPLHVRYILYTSMHWL